MDFLIGFSVAVLVMLTAKWVWLRTLRPLIHRRETKRRAAEWRAYWQAW